MAESILAVTELRNGEFRKISYEVVTAARQVADAIGASVTALVLGEDVGGIAENLTHYGPDKILLADDPVLSTFTTETYTSVIADIVNNQSPAIIVLGASCQGKDLSARLSARLDAGMAMDCVKIEANNGKVSYTRPIFGGKLNAEIAIDGPIQIATIRPNVFTMAHSDRETVVEKVPVEVETPNTRVVNIQFAEGDKVELSEAEVIVAGGRGTDGNFTPIENLAQVFNGAVAASRTVIDEGWRPHSEQVGQTGITVSPNLYIACGISGAVQHFAGMSGSKYIVGINKDPEAPIFQKSDYGIVGDLFTVIPSLIEELEKLKDS